MNTIIKNSLVYDGTGIKPFKADVLITKEKIHLIRANINFNSENLTVINGTGLALCPGFIDTHSHSDLEIFRNNKMEHAIRQGITTEIIGQDGFSLAPLNKKMVNELVEQVTPLLGKINKEFWWTNYSDYRKAIEQASASTKIEGLVGHGTIRMCVIGNENRKLNTEELIKMKDLTAKALDDGAKGISFGLTYHPGSYADDEEIIEICKVVAQNDGIAMIHMRNEQDLLLESVDFVAKIARVSNVRIHISHLRAIGYKNWGKIEKVLQKIKNYRDEGIDITYDNYPYVATCTGLKVLIPTWAYEGGEMEFLDRLKREEIYQEILKEVFANIEKRGGKENIFIASTSTNKWLLGKNLEQICEKTGLSSAETVIEILKEEKFGVVAIYFSISKDDLNCIMKDPLQGICTDGIISDFTNPGVYGSFPRVLGYYTRKMGLMTIEEAIRKMTSEPAIRMRLWDRGIIREGMTADLVLFDPEKIRDDNTFLNPVKYPIGIKAVFVNGKLNYSELKR